MMDFKAIAAEAAASTPMQGAAAVPIIRDRVLRIDGDGLAYYCAGKEGTSLMQARSFVAERIKAFMDASGAERYTILLTGSGGHKGHRYAVARAKPYQAQRTGAQRPANWAPLRSGLESGFFGHTLLDFDREADDRFGEFGHAKPELSVHATQDKDMRMVPGWHLDWKDMRMFYLAPHVYEATFNDKVFGLKWFWLQMLQGDTADNIPGVPKAYGKLCGEVGAAKIIAAAKASDEAAMLVAAAYESHYGDDWLINMMEQAVLLWMRRGPEAKWDDAMMTGGPLNLFFNTDDKLARRALYDLNERIKEAIELSEPAALQA